MATNMKSLNGYGFDASALGGYDASHYATTEDIQQVRNEIPTELPNPNALTINGQSYDGSAAVNVTITSGDGGANIDDTQASSTTTYSSQKIEDELNALNQAKVFVGDAEPDDETVTVWIDTDGEADEIRPYTKIATNYDDFSWTSGKRLDLDANEQDYVTGLVCDYIDAARIKSIRYSLYVIVGLTTIIACYDKDKNFLPDESVQQNDTENAGTWGLCEGVFVPTENVRYVRICRFTNLVNSEGANIVTLNLAFEEDYAETKKMLPTQWQGKKWVAFGTSITDTANELAPDGTSSGKYPKYLEKLSGMYCVNYGIAGGTISNGGTSGAGEILSNIKSEAALSDLQNADLVTIEGFVNDFAANVPRGTVSDTESSTLMGALYQAVTYIYGVNPYATVVLLTDHTGQSTDTGNFSVTRVNELGEYQYQYADALADISGYLGAHCIDCGRKSQINQWHADYLIDHIHHTELGGEQYAHAIWDELKNIHCNADLKTTA